MPLRIQSPVGPGQRNSPADVLVVKQLLNRCIGLLFPLALTKEDGLYNNTDKILTSAFQARVLKMKFPDAVVEPHNLTWSQLHAIADRPWPPQVAALVRKCLTPATAVKAKWQIPISVTLSQTAQETAWGTKVVGNAYFGIKGIAPDGQTQKIDTHEENQLGVRIPQTDGFRAYNDIDSAFDDYGRFLRTQKRFQACFAFTNDPLQFAALLAAAHYATDSGYGASIRGIILTNGLLRYDT